MPLLACLDQISRRTLLDIKGVGEGGGGWGGGEVGGGGSQHLTWD